MFGFLDDSGQLKRVSYSANNATGFRQSGSLSGPPAQTTPHSILVTGQHIRNENEEFTPQIRTVETSTVAGPVLRKVLITKRIRPNASSKQDSQSFLSSQSTQGSEDDSDNQGSQESERSQQVELDHIHQTEHTGLLGNALRRQLHFGPPVPISIRPDDTSDVYGPTTASPGRRLPSRIPSIPAQIQNLLEPSNGLTPLFPPVPPGSYPIGGLDPRLRRPPSREESPNMEENSNQRPSQRPPLPFRLSPLMRILLRMISEEAAALEPYFQHAYGTRHQDDYRPRPYNDPYHSRRRRPYDIPPRQSQYEDQIPRIRPQDNPPICGRLDDHICGMHMYQDGPLPQNLPPLPQRQLPVPPLNPYINVNPYVNNNPDPNEIDEHHLLRRLLAARGRISPPQNPPNFYPDHNHFPQYHNSQPQSPPPLNTQFQNSNHQSRFKNSFHNQYPYNSYPPAPPPPHPQYQNYPQLHFQNSHPQPSMQNINYNPHFQNSDDPHFHNNPPLQNHPYTNFHNHPPHPPFRNAQIPPRFPPSLALLQYQNSGAHNQIPNTIPPTFQNTSPPPPLQNTTYFPPSPPASYLTSTFPPTGVRNVQILDNLNEEDSE